MPSRPFRRAKSRLACTCHNRAVRRPSPHETGPGRDGAGSQADDGLEFSDQSTRNAMKPKKQARQPAAPTQEQLKETVLDAFASIGSEGQGKDALQGYLAKIACK